MWTAATVVVCALELLGRPASSFPPIALLEHAPPGVSRNAEAYANRGPDTIVLITSSAAFRDAQAATYRCGNHDAVRKLASILVHEEAHLRHNASEREAYEAQRLALITLGVSPASRLYHSVLRAGLTVAKREKEQKGRAEVIMARRTP